MGLYKGFDEGVELYVKKREIVEPKEETSEIYQKKYPIFNSAYAAVRSVNDEINRINNG